MAISQRTTTFSRYPQSTHHVPRGSPGRQDALISGVAAAIPFGNPQSGAISRTGHHVQQLNRLGPHPPDPGRRRLAQPAADREPQQPEHPPGGSPCRTRDSPSSSTPRPTGPWATTRSPSSRDRSRPRRASAGIDIACLGASRRLNIPTTSWDIGARSLKLTRPAPHSSMRTASRRPGQRVFRSARRIVTSFRLPA